MQVSNSPYIMTDETANTTHDNAEMYFLLNAEAILIQPDTEHFTEEITRIKAIITALPDDWKLLASKHLAMLIFKNRKHLIALSEKLPDAEKRGIVNLSEWTGLGEILKTEYEQVKRDCAVDDDKIDEVNIAMGLYHSVMDSTCPDMKAMNPGQKLYWKMKAAKAMTDRHFQAQSKAADDDGGSSKSNGLVGKTSTTYSPETTPALNDPDIVKRIEEGERILANGNKTD